MLFSTSEERSSELTDEVSRATAAMSTITLLVAHERVHRKATQSTCPVASRAVAHASVSVACIGA